MDLDRLHEFERIASRGSVSAAARELGLSVATLSARLHSFEKNLGIPLFERAGRAVILTDAGRCLLANAEDILSHYHTIAGGLRSLDDHRYARLVIAIDNPFPVHLGPLMDHLNLANPDLELHLISTGNLNLRSALLDGTVDLCFVSRVERPAQDGISCRQVSVPSQNVILPAEHPLISRPGVRLCDLEGECFILYEDGPNAFAREFQLRNLEASGIRHTRYDYPVSAPYIQFLVPMGKGVLITPYHLVDLPNAAELPLTDVPCPAYPYMLSAENPPNPDIPRFIRDFFAFARESANSRSAQEGIGK
ncbi:MAG: LysR family transcriptional regulator [Clostridiales bacterium]|nr:LysR family transcriptional regulator [Clostridiales bacterium]